MTVSRRSFLVGTGVTSLARFGSRASALADASPWQPVLISAANGFPYLDRGYKALLNGVDTLDAAIEVVRGPEEDPNEDSVGLGGLPNEDGVVQLDASCMHGPTRRAGAVGALENIVHAAMVAKAVMEHTGHVMLVGEGATKFGLAMGNPKQDLLTEHSRKIWLLWKETHSSRDWWGPGIGAPGWVAPGETSEDHAVLFRDQSKRLESAAADLGIPLDKRADAIRKVLYPPMGTIHCSALNAKGEISGVTTTSGLAWKLSGRLGDSPIIGAGCYTDPEVGSAGATGNGEENIKVAGAHTIVENMRAAVFLLTFVFALEAAPQEPTPKPAPPETQTTTTTPKIDATHRTEPEEPEISDREKRELEIRAQQSIGKTLVSPDGKFFVYEWRRPYSWDKDFGSLPKSAPEHMQSWIYRVDPEISPTDSKYLFLYESGVSQWLGSLSPDAKRVSFYSLDDDNKLKTGVWDFAKTKITWFTSAPDEKHLDQAPVWTSNAELIYPGHAGKLVRASVTTGKASVCDDCTAIYEKIRTSLTPPAHGKVPEELGPDAKILARSHLGQLSIYERSTPN